LNFRCGWRLREAFESLNFSAFFEEILGIAPVASGERGQTARDYHISLVVHDD
jgi:hypothetical protein